MAGPIRRPVIPASRPSASPPRYAVSALACYDNVRPHRLPPLLADKNPTGQTCASSTAAGRRRMCQRVNRCCPLGPRLCLGRQFVRWDRIDVLCCFCSGFWKGRQEIKEPGRVPGHEPVVEAVRPIPPVRKSNNSFCTPIGVPAPATPTGVEAGFRVPIPAVSACGLNRRLMSAIPIGMNFMPPRSRNCASTWAEQKPTKTRTRIAPRSQALPGTALPSRLRLVVIASDQRPRRTLGPLPARLGCEPRRRRGTGTSARRPGTRPSGHSEPSGARMLRQSLRSSAFPGGAWEREKGRRFAAPPTRSPGGGRFRLRPCRSRLRRRWWPCRPAARGASTPS